MKFVLLKKNLRECRWLLLSSALAIFVFCWLRVWMVSRLATERFRAILEMLPTDWRRFLSVDLEWLITYPGRISLAYQELIVILCVALWSIARGSDAVSGELNRGTLEMLLAQPLSRRRILGTQVLVTLTGVAVLAGAAFAGTGAGIYTTQLKEEVAQHISLPFYVPGVGTELPLPFSKKTTRYTPMSDKVEMRLFLPATANLFALGVMIAGFSTFMSAWDRYRWRTIGIVTGVLVVQVMLKIAGMASDGTRWLKYLSVLSAYEPESFVRVADRTPEATWSFMLYDANGSWTEFGPAASHLLLLGIGVVSLIAASEVFARRDLPAPL
jgi:ABC-2 type transport system permease protein